MKNYDFLVLGAGIFGLSTAIELRRRKYSVGILNPDEIPHPLAASTDISKVVRMEYGSDVEYLKMAVESMEEWRAWNDLFKDTLYHETGYTVLSKKEMDFNSPAYEPTSYQNLLENGFKPERLDTGQISARFPAFQPGFYTDGFYHNIGGFAESGRVLETLVRYARQLEIGVHQGQTAEEIVVENNRVHSVKTREGQTFTTGHAIVCAGNFTPYLLPELKPFMKITGHPVFHLQPSRPEYFMTPHFSVFAADISNTGWYGFPMHPREKVVKIANHGVGLELHPEEDERVVYPEDEAHLRTFLEESLPILADDPVVYTRRCCYTDTLDGHFWLDRHPEIRELTVGSGGSGHGFKMGPVVGRILATLAEGGKHKWSERYQWRNLDAETIQREEARNLK